VPAEIDYHDGKLEDRADDEGELAAAMAELPQVAAA
jgi:hypothetical protein